MAGNFDPDVKQSLMRIADQLTMLNKAIEVPNQLLRQLVERTGSGK
jgi:hypothetical protein